jgi:hypothetical protein
MRKIFIITLLFPLLLISSSKGQANNDVPPVLLEVEKKISSVLNKIDSDLSHATKKISKVGIHAPEAREILRELCKSNSFAVDCAIVDKDGTMIVLEPERYSQFEGADISKQEQVIRIHKTRKPVLSRAFRAVEGFDAVDLQYPVFSHHGKMKGSVSILIRPEAFLSQIVFPSIEGVPVDIWVLETEGRILFDTDKEEIGRNLFQDPRYKPFKQLLLLAKKIKKEHSGSGTFEFLGTGTEEHVTKRAYWSTVELHKTEWRVVVTQILK